MTCLVCQYQGDFGTLDISGGEIAVGRLPPPIGRLGSVLVFVCPDCGALHSSMRNKIIRADRKPSVEEIRRLD